MKRLPPVKPKVLVAALKRAGFVERQQRGSHLRLFHPISKRQAVIPMHNRDMKRGTLRSVLKQAAISPEELFDLR